MSQYELSELYRRLDNLIMLGLIHEVDLERKKLKVKIGEIITAWLPWPASIGRNYKRWQPLKPGIQVLLACPSGEPR
jgi:phage baseplate assembly protein V